MGIVDTLNRPEVRRGIRVAVAAMTLFGLCKASEMIGDYFKDQQTIQDSQWEWNFDYPDNGENLNKLPFEIIPLNSVKGSLPFDIQINVDPKNRRPFTDTLDLQEGIQQLDPNSMPKP